MIITYCTTREQAIRWAIAENGVPCHVIVREYVSFRRDDKSRAQSFHFLLQTSIAKKLAEERIVSEKI